jgi:hypothetical protein
LVLFTRADADDLLDQAEGARRAGHAKRKAVDRKRDFRDSSILHNTGDWLHAQAVCADYQQQRPENRN